MLAITAKVKVLKSEIQSAQAVVLDIIGSLRSANDNTDYRMAIGIYAVQMPDWRILTAEKEQFKDVIRKVCTEEISAIQGQIKFVEFFEELEKLNAWIQIPLK